MRSCKWIFRCSGGKPQQASIALSNVFPIRMLKDNGDKLCEQDVIVPSDVAAYVYGYELLISSVISVLIVEKGMVHNAMLIVLDYTN